jgi:hypothetical protein
MLRLLRKVSFLLGFLLFNPLAGLAAIISGLIVASRHGEWAVIALVAAGFVMFYVFGMYYEGPPARFGGKK